MCHFDSIILHSISVSLLMSGRCTLCDWISFTLHRLLIDQFIVSIDLNKCKYLQEMSSCRRVLTSLEYVQHQKKGKIYIVTYIWPQTSESDWVNVLRPATYTWCKGTKRLQIIWPAQNLGKGLRFHLRSHWRRKICQKLTPNWWIRDRGTL